MKRALILSVALAATAVVNAAQIERVVVRQQWPWSTDVKVEFVLTDVTVPVDLSLRAYNGSTELDSAALLATARGLERFAIPASGVYTFTVDPVKAFGTRQKELADFRVELSVAESAAEMLEPLYKIFDLQDGTVENVSRADLLNGKYGTYETDYSKFGAGYNTTLSDVLVWTGVTNNLEYMTTKLVMRKIKAKDRSFMMGTDSSLDTKHSGYIADETYHQVSFSNDFYMSVFEVTQRQYYEIVKDHVDTGHEVKSAWPSFYKNRTYRQTRPVENVSYASARGDTNSHFWPEGGHAVADWSVLKILRDRLAPSGSPLIDLPTEAQWEYACRAGTPQALYCGIDLEYYSNREDPAMNLLGRYMMNGGLTGSNKDTWPDEDVDTSLGTAKVGSYAPNAYGLYDMSGNVLEWCLDWYVPTLSGPVANPIGPQTSELSSEYARVIRGGGHGTNSRGCRSATRSRKAFRSFLTDVGLRLCLTVED